MSINDNIKRIKNEIVNIKEKNNIDRDVILMAATKTRSVIEIQKAIDSGINYIGENRVQEAIDKFDQIGGNINKHLIGHLQKNKVKYALRLFDCIQSVEDKGLINEIEKRAAKISKNIDVFLEINISNEKSKFGLDKNQIDEFIKTITEKNYIKLKGFMTMFPYDFSDKDLIKYSKEMRTLFEDSKKYNRYDNIDLKYLSMGMSNDYKIAIREGSNLIRLGSAIFGERSY